MSSLARIISVKDIGQAEKEMLGIGAGTVGISIMAPKAVFRAVKLSAVNVTAANIIKQDMLSSGGEAVTSYGTIDHSEKATDMLLLGTLAQYKKLFYKLKIQQFGLPSLAEQIEKAIDVVSSVPAPILSMEFGKKTSVMGILNVTPDSFSDGGRFLSAGSAVKRAFEMLDEGADILDIGGESTRSGAEEINFQEEIERVIPVIEDIRRSRGQANRHFLISVDTRKSRVAEAALKAGADMVNDVSGLCFDPKMPEILAVYGVPVIIMHSKGDPKTMQNAPRYDDLIYEMMLFFEERMNAACKAGIKETNIVIDPGIGFGKTLDHNIEIIRRLEEFRCFGRPVCIGASRKSFIGKILSVEDPSLRDVGTASTISIAISKKVDIIRVHNVGMARQTAVISDTILREGA